MVPERPTLAVQPIILATQDEPRMFDFFWKYPWVLGIYRYANIQSLLYELESHVVSPAVAKAHELQGFKEELRNKTFDESMRLREGHGKQDSFRPHFSSTSWAIGLMCMTFFPDFNA
jgi:hypothetical protein